MRSLPRKVIDLGNLSFIVLANNSGKVITKAFQSIKWASEIVVVDTNKKGSSDSTLEIAKKFTSKIFWFKRGGLSEWRNKALEIVTKDWVFYLDADETVSRELKNDLIRISRKRPKVKDPGVFDIHRNNFFLGKKWHRGDWVTRFFFKERLLRWHGKLHETPLVRGTTDKLRSSLNHYTHNDIESMTLKTLKWSKTEGGLLFKKNHPPIVGWRFIRMMLTELYKRLIKEGYWKNGVEGWIEAIFQMFSVFFTYVRLWEYQTGKIKYKNEDGLY